MSQLQPSHSFFTRRLLLLLLLLLLLGNFVAYDYFLKFTDHPMPRSNLDEWHRSSFFRPQAARAHFIPDRLSLETRPDRVNRATRQE